MKCWNCGCEVNDNFCSNCGKAVGQQPVMDNNWVKQNTYSSPNAYGYSSTYNQNYITDTTGDNYNQTPEEELNPLVGFQGKCFWVVTILGVIFAIIFFSNGDILSGICLVGGAFTLCPLVLNRLPKKRQRVMGFVTIVLIGGGLFFTGDMDWIIELLIW